MLVAVGRDTNNQIYPLAWAVKWFLEKLFTDLCHPMGVGLTLISDQQKGLISVLNECFLDLEHRMCARHIYTNWQKTWKGLNRKMSTFVEDFDDQLQKLKAMGETSTDQLLEIHVHHWAKSYFKGTCKCDVVDNNMVKAFNAWILEARCRPIITMLEEIIVIVMTRMHVKRTWAEKWRTNISPVALEKLDKNATTSTKCMLAWNGDGGFKVIHEDNQHTVDLKELKCTCRDKEKYAAAYSQVLQPIKGKNFGSREMIQFFLH
uniref:MULE transposase domain-containing protein n=1 Tax=Gossypium raimondii TaxID=29730 RepID=A0A0D2R1H1_GOSRA|nr:hypothetical protein B456_010G037000 [Gossypium raimondii]